MQTAVVFDCESDRLFDRSRRPPRATSKTEEEERREEIFRMECTVVCALVLPVDEVLEIANVKPNDAADRRAQRLIEHAAERVVCWKTGPASTPRARARRRSSRCLPPSTRRPSSSGTTSWASTCRCCASTTTRTRRGTRRTG